MSILKPDLISDSIETIDLSLLQKKNIKGILLDNDNTLIDMSKVVKPNIISWVKEAQNQGFKLLMLTNSNNLNKIIPICKLLNIDYVSKAKKPLSSGYLKAIQKLNLKVDQVCMIGDQILTDVIGANRLKIFSIYVKPISKEEYWYTKWKRPIEALILKHYNY